jgi:hypothetical protein
MALIICWRNGVIVVSPMVDDPHGSQTSIDDECTTENYRREATAKRFSSTIELSGALQGVRFNDLCTPDMGMN